MTTVGLDDETMILLPNEIETRCPMCRTPTTATLNGSREAELKEKYPRVYRAREIEARSEDEAEGAASVETLTIYIGNSHSLIRLEDSESHIKHEWKFFVRPSRTDLIEEVQIFLVSISHLKDIEISVLKPSQHPTFRNPRIIVQYPPYEVRRLGWGYFTIFANIILKAGYSWMSSEAEDAPDGGKRGS